jgi:hypothetical protein
VLWFKTGRHQVHSAKVSILDIFPTFAEMLGVPDGRGNGRHGESLIARIDGKKSEPVSVGVTV